MFLLTLDAIAIVELCDTPSAKAAPARVRPAVRSDRRSDAAAAGPR